MINRTRKRITLLAASFILCGIYLFCARHFAAASPQKETEHGEEMYCYVNGREGIEGTRILSQRVDKKNYLFLPSGMDLSALQINFSCPLGEWVTFEDTLIRDKVLIDVLNKGTYNKEKEFYQLSFQVCNAEGLNKDFKLRIMQSEYIPAVFLVSDDPENEGRGWVESTPDHSNVAEASVYEMDEEGNLICKQKAEKLRIRGNFTASAKKESISDET